MAGRERSAPTLPTTTEAEYRKLLGTQRASGGTLRTFAKRVGIPLGRLQWWKWELARRDRLRAGKSSAALECVTPPTEVAFVPVRILPDIERAECPDVRPMARAAAYEVLLRGGRLVRVPGEFEPASLTALVAALEAVPC